MKTHPWIICALGALLSAGCVGTPMLEAQSPNPAESGPPDALEQLVAPIALYPDVLVAIILPAATASTDLVLASRYLDAGGDPDNVDSQPWDESVRSLAHYPDLVKWMNENLAWSQQIGAAYLEQPEAVMDAIQRARARALANGTLANTPQQQVVVEDGYIRIIPAQPEAIYVPRYDPEIIFVDQPPDFYPGPLITFGPSFGVGFWLCFDCDWGQRAIWCDPHPREHWHAQTDWRHREFAGPNRTAGANQGWHRWAPPPGRRPPPRVEMSGPRPEAYHPAPPPGAPHFDPNRVPARRAPLRRYTPRRPATPPVTARPVPPPANARHNETAPVVRPPSPQEPRRPAPPPAQRPESNRDLRREPPGDVRAAPQRAVSPPPHRIESPPPARAEPQRMAPPAQHMEPHAPSPAQRVESHAAPPPARQENHAANPPAQAQRDDRDKEH